MKYTHMKKILIALAVVLMIAGCSRTTEFTGDLTGQWNIYKLTYKNNDITTYPAPGPGDSLKLGNYDILFTADGKYTQTDQTGSKTSGTYQLTNNNATLILTDAATKAVASWDVLVASDASLNLKHAIDGTNPSSLDVLLIQYAKGVGFDATKNSSLTVKLTP